MSQLHNELESLKELLLTYEQSIERKDQVICNLTQGLQKQKEKFDMLKTFCEWKMKHNDMKREVRTEADVKPNLLKQVQVDSLDWHCDICCAV